MSITGLAYKNGLYIFLLRQFYRGIPDELEESAYLDGSGVFRTFFSIIIPLAVPMLVTVFIFSFSWLWTDDFYVNTLFQSSYWTTEGPPLLNSSNFVGVVPPTLNLYLGSSPTGWVAYTNAVGGTTTILVALPIIIAFVFLQGRIVQGIERSGIVG
jgi:multiple sugar transport system permease protein